MSNHEYKKDQKTEYLRRMDIRVKRFARSFFQDYDQEQIKEITEKLMIECENIYDEVELITKRLD